MTVETISPVGELADRFWQWFLSRPPIYATVLGDERYDDRLADPSAAGRAEEVAGLKGFLADAEARSTATGSTRKTRSRSTWSRLSRGSGCASTPTTSTTSTPSTRWAARTTCRATCRASSASIHRSEWIAPSAGSRRSPNSSPSTGPTCWTVLPQDGPLPRPLSPAWSTRSAGRSTRRLDESPLLAGASRAGRRVARENPPGASGKRAPALADHLAAIEGYAGVRSQVGGHVGPARRRGAVRDDDPGLDHARGDAPGPSRLRRGADRADRRGIEPRSHVSSGSSTSPRCARRSNADRGNLRRGRERSSSARRARSTTRTRPRRAISAGCRRRRARCAPSSRTRRHEAPPAFYFPPAPDGSRGGIYYVNTYQPQSRPLYRLATTTFHEATPGPPLPDRNRKRAHRAARLSTLRLTTDRPGVQRGLGSVQRAACRRAGPVRDPRGNGWGCSTHGRGVPPGW